MTTIEAIKQIMAISTNFTQCCSGLSEDHVAEIQGICRKALTSQKPAPDENQYGRPTEWREGAEYLCQDADGDWYFYAGSRSPTAGGGCWLGAWTLLPRTQGTPNPNWRETLVTKAEFFAQMATEKQASKPVNHTLREAIINCLMATATQSEGVTADAIIGLLPASVVNPAQPDSIGYKCVPCEPTAAMIEAAAEGYMPFGDMDIALRMAILAAPDVQGDPVAWIQRSYLNLIRESNVALHNVVVRGSILDGDGDVVPLFTAPQPAEQPECGCCGQTVKCDDDCDSVAIRKVEQQPTPDVSALVEALESLLEVQDEDCRHDHQGYCQNHNLDHVDDGCRVARAKTALAAHHKHRRKP